MLCSLPVVAVVNVHSEATFPVPTPEQREQLKPLGPSFLIYSRETPLTQDDNVKPFEIVRSDFDGNGNTSSKILGRATSWYIGVNSSGTKVTYFDGAFNKEAYKDKNGNYHGRATEADIWVMDAQGQNKQKISKKPYPFPNNLSFHETEDRVTFTSDTKTGRSFWNLNSKAWELDMQGNDRLLLDLGNPSSSKYVGDVHVYKNQITYRYKGNVFVGELTEQAKTNSNNDYAFGKSCEQDFGPNGLLFCTNSGSHKSVHIHKRNQVEDLKGWSSAKKDLELFDWKTGEYRWTNKQEWLVTNPETIHPDCGIYVVNWKTEAKVRLTFENMELAKNSNLASQAMPKMGELRFLNSVHIQTHPTLPKPKLIDQKIHFPFSYGFTHETIQINLQGKRSTRKQP